MKNVTIRIDSETGSMLSEISTRPTTAVQSVLEVFTWLRRKTINELRGRFTREELIGFADSFNGLLPTWQLMSNPDVFMAHCYDAEKYQRSFSSHEADYNEVAKKISVLTSAQSTIFQLELWAFWNRDEEGPSPDLDTFIERFK
jgi:hypothetical protein